MAERLLGLLYDRGAGFYHYASLYRFKRKFGPRWEPRYLLYPDGDWNLARVAAAAALIHRPRGRVTANRGRHLVPGGMAAR